MERGVTKFGDLHFSFLQKSIQGFSVIPELSYGMFWYHPYDEFPIWQTLEPIKTYVIYSVLMYVLESYCLSHFL